MGSSFYIARNERERILGLILNGDYKCVVKLTGKDKETNQPVKGAYQVFKEFDEKKIRDYANTTAKENNIKLSKIEVWTLKLELLKDYH